MAPDSTSSGSAAADTEDLTRTVAHAEDDDRSRMSFLEHLDELRRRIVYSAYAVIGSWLIALFYWEPLYQFMVRYFGENGGRLIYTQPMAGFTFSLKITLLVAVIASSPFVFSQIWLFVAPGLYAREKKVVIPFVLFSSILFGIGAWFGHSIGFPSMWRFFASFELGPIEYMPQLDVAFSFYVKMILGLGLVFQMPLLVFFLSRFGIVTASFMLRKFKFAFLGIVVIAAFITPSGDPVNLMIFSAPMLILYVVSIGVAWLFGKKRKSAGDEA
jgi:sec-independent protein translocase protein TatC